MINRTSSDDGKTVLVSEYIPRPHALDFHARANRFAILVMHRRAGKTVMCINDIIDKAMQCTLPYPQYSYVAPFYAQAKSVAWTILKHYTQEIAERVLESELSVILKGNGAKIRLFGADNPDSLRGLYHDGCVLDEYAQISPRIFGEVIAPALADRKGWIVFIGTPMGRNSFYEIWEEAIVSDAWFSKMLKASESGVIDDEELKLMRSLPGSDENTYRQEFECDFTAAVRGAYYGDQLAELEPTNCGSYPYDPNKEVLTAWDIGYTDDTSIWFYQMNGKELAIIDFHTVSGNSVDQVMDTLRRKPYAYGPMGLPHDARNKSFQTGKSTRELMLEEGAVVHILPSISVQDGIQAVRATLPQCYFNTDSPDVRVGLSALRLYQREFDDKNKIFKNKPKHDWASNPADAFRMLAIATNPRAARRANKTLNSAPKKPTNNVLTMDNLWRDRAARKKNLRI